MKSEKGQAAVEFALVLPILLLLVLGIIDFGRILYNMNTVNLVCQQTCRYAGIKHLNSNTDVDQKADEFAIGKLDKTQVTGSIVTAETTADYITIQVVYHMSLITPITSFIGIDKDRTITSKATYKIE